MKQWKYWLAIIILSMLLGWQVFRNASGSNDQIADLKRELFARDSMIRISDSLVVCLVQDLESYRTLADKVPVRIKVDRPVMVTKIEYVYVTERDTITVMTDGMLEDFYPDRNDWVIRHWITPFTDGTFFSDWEFRPVQLDLVINERQKGLYEAQLAGPAFLQVRDLKVNSLPMDTPRPVRGMLIGGGVGYNWTDMTVQPILHAGYGWNRHSVLASAQPNQTSVNYLYRLK